MREVLCDGRGEDGARCRDALADALMRPGGVVVLLVFGQDGSQVRFAEDEAAIKEFAPAGVPTRRSQIAFTRCLHGVRKIVVPAP